MTERKGRKGGEKGRREGEGGRKKFNNTKCRWGSDNTEELGVSYTAAAAAAKSLQSCPTLCDPRDGSPPGSPSLGFSRQEHWSGLPFPSPMHESKKWSHSVMSDSLRPHGLQPTRLLCPWDFPGKSTRGDSKWISHFGNNLTGLNKVTYLLINTMQLWSAVLRYSLTWNKNNVHIKSVSECL